MIVQVTIAFGAPEGSGIHRYLVDGIPDGPPGDSYFNAQAVARVVTHALVEFAMEFPQTRPLRIDIENTATKVIKLEDAAP